MILSFQAEFVPKIQAGTKIFTLREDKPGRWKKWNLIHFYQGNPRNGGTPFFWNQPDLNIGQTCVETCLFTVRLKITRDGIDGIFWKDSHTEAGRHVFAVADGFDSWESFCAYHLKDAEEVELKLISWFSEEELFKALEDRVAAWHKEKEVKNGK